MPAHSIMVDRPDQRYAADADRFRVAQQRAFARTMPKMRVGLTMKVEKSNLVCESFNVRFRHPAALRYFRKRLAEFMREMDGTVVVEDPQPSDRHP